jgi:hypothetical protein
MAESYANFMYMVGNILICVLISLPLSISLYLFSLSHFQPHPWKFIRQISTTFPFNLHHGMAWLDALFLLQVDVQWD